MSSLASSGIDAFDSKIEVCGLSGLREFSSKGRFLFCLEVVLLQCVLLFLSKCVSEVVCPDFLVGVLFRLGCLGDGILGIGFLVIY